MATERIISAPLETLWRGMRVINKAINARYETASQIHEEIQTPAVLALLVLAKALSVLEGGCMCSFAGSIFQEKQQAGDLASSSRSKTSP